MTNTPRDTTATAPIERLPVVDDDRTARALRLLQEPYVMELVETAAALDLGDRPLALRLLRLLAASRRARFS